MIAFLFWHPLCFWITTVFFLSGWNGSYIYGALLANFQPYVLDPLVLIYGCLLHLELSFICRIFFFHLKSSKQWDELKLYVFCIPRFLFLHFLSRICRPFQFWHLQSRRKVLFFKKCQFQIDVSFSCACTVIDHEFRQNIVRVVVDIHEALAEWIRRLLWSCSRFSHFFLMMPQITFN